MHPQCHWPALTLINLMPKSDTQQDQQLEPTPRPRICAQPPSLHTSQALVCPDCPVALTTPVGVTSPQESVLHGAQQVQSNSPEATRPLGGTPERIGPTLAVLWTTPERKGSNRPSSSQNPLHVSQEGHPLTRVKCPSHIHTSKPWKPPSLTHSLWCECPGVTGPWEALLPAATRGPSGPRASICFAEKWGLLFLQRQLCMDL